jgi:hypothetical protein
MQTAEGVTADERLKLKKELTAARDRQAAAVEARDKSNTNSGLRSASIAANL